MKDNISIIHQVSDVVDDGYKINDLTSAEFKVFPQHPTYHNPQAWITGMHSKP
jgi:hypothetical protein